MKPVAAYSTAVVLVVIVLGSQSSSFCKNLHPLISYRIHVDAKDLSGFDVEMQVRGADDTVRIAMASHPEYDDRYWRYVENLRAESRGVTLQLAREEDQLWRVVAPRGDLTVRYRIRLPPQTTPIRAAWRPFLSETGGLIGDVHSLMYVVGATSSPGRVTIDLPVGWAIASGLETTKDPQTFTASSVELLLDSPIVVGQFRQWDFTVRAVKHQVIFLPDATTVSFDSAAFVAGIQKLVIEAFNIFGKPPYRNYTFLYLDGAYGALEHLNSVTLGARSQNLARGLSGTFDTTAHEYFHTWNLMHVRPVERVGLRYHPASPTGELWWSEGVTIYFSDVLMRRAKLPTFDPNRLSYLEHNIAAYLASPSYSRISAERVSRGAEDPLALGDDYASTHLQGNVLGTMLDLMIRESTGGQHSLDEVMRRLSERFTPQRGITGRDIETAVRDVCNCDPQPFFERYVRGARPLDFDRYLRAIGLRTKVSWSAAVDNDGRSEPDLRIFAFNAPGESMLRIRLTNPTSAWARAGLHTGDRLVSLDGHPVTTTNDFRSWLGKLQVGETVRVAVAREGAISNVPVVITGYDRPTVRVDEIANATAAQRRLRTQWVTAQP
ncbi:MAG TPA: PDZ domain-containing protein [Pyrinomonadaceae bacterium]|nr:PDZ domain-containing protein [Pyrinomonadaceae bacterium]